jgi:hypothetical protein
MNFRIQYRGSTIFYYPNYWFLIGTITLIVLSRHNDNSRFVRNSCEALRNPVLHLNYQRQRTILKQQGFSTSTRFYEAMNQNSVSNKYSASSITASWITTTSILQAEINDGSHDYHHLPFDTSHSISSVDTETTHSLVLLSSSISSPLDDLSSPTVPLIVFIAITIGVLANGWISRLISGDQGLGSYLSDGSGFKKSNFKPLQATNPENGKSNNNIDRAVQDDPLPWLRLPNLDYVEVAGPETKPLSRYTKTLSPSKMVGKGTTQENGDGMVALEELELLRLRMQEQLLRGNINDAERLRNELERSMKKNNIQFTKENDQ